MPRKFHPVLRAPAHAPVTITLSEEEGDAVADHLAALALVWAEMRDRAGLPAFAQPCAHVKAAIRLMLWPAEGGMLDIDRRVFAAAGIAVPDMTAEAGPLAGCTDGAMLATHVKCGCAFNGSFPTIRVQYAKTGRKAPEDGPDPIVPDGAIPVPGYAHEAALFQAYREAISATVRDFCRMAKADKVCDHLICAVRRKAAHSHLAPGAKVEKTLLARAGTTVPDVSDPAVERWLNIPGDDGTLKAHLDSCPLGYDTARWPKIAFMPDGAVRPVRKPAAKGSVLVWPDPVWS